MNFDEFIKEWTGRFLEVHGSSNAKYQCVDLVNGYIRDVLGLPIIKWTDAKDFPTKAGDKYDYIKNTPKDIPKKGDIMVWWTNHVSVFIEGTAGSFRSFDQNWPAFGPCHIQGHYYNSVAGWLRPKLGFAANDLKECLSQHTHLMGVIKQLDEKIERLEKEIKQSKEKIAKLEKAEKVLIDEAGTAGDDLLIAEESIKQLKKEKEQFEKKIKQVREFLKPYLYFNLSGVQLVKLGLLKILGSDIQPKGVNKDGERIDKSIPSVD